MQRSILQHDVTSLPVKNLFPSKWPELGIISVNSQNSIFQVMEILTQHKILSAPVYSEEKGEYVGLIDMVDIVVYLMEIIASENPNEFNSLFRQFTAEDVSNISMRNPYRPVDMEAPVLTAIRFILSWKVHRIPVIDGVEMELKMILSQSRVIQFIREHLGQFSQFSQKRVFEFSNVLKPVFVLNQNHSAISGFQQIVDKKVSSIGIVDKEHQLIGVLSASNLKNIGIGEANFDKLFLPVTEFLKLDPNPTSFETVTEDDTFRTVVEKMSEKKAHVVFIIKNHKPIGVISMIDVLEFFSNQFV